MHRINFIHQPRADVDPVRRWHAVLASCALHGLAFCLLLLVTILYRSHLPPNSGSAPGAPSITLETMVIVSPPPEPAPIPTPSPVPPPVTLTASIPPTAPVPPAPARVPEVAPILPEEGVPVLAVQSAKPAQPAPAKPRTAPHPTTQPATIMTTQSNPRPPSASTPSSYAPGPNALPHPPYPIEARNRGQTGVVVMNVQFDAHGDVAYAEVAQSSGVPILDTSTRTFIRAHWHSSEYAGQTISQPVRYSLENL